MRLGLLAATGSAGLLLAALGFQYLGDLPPCKLCIWQRWPHVVAVVAGLGLLAFAWRPLMLAGAFAAATSAGIALYHVGVEQKWWQGPQTCSAPALGDLSADDLLGDILNAPVTQCGDILWNFAGISMAGWNGLISLALAALWLVAFTGKSAHAR
jgi:disulfide bond formation protein DsbB